MTEIPLWWLIVSAAFFAVNLLFFVVMAVVLLKLLGIVQALQPKVAELTGTVQGLVTTVQGVAHKVEELTATVKNRADGVGSKAQEVVGSTGMIMNTASRQFERFAPFITGALTAMRLVKALNEMRKGRSATDSTKKKTLEKVPATKKKRFF
ncbi:hypothetical protein EON79_06000 [bacterium]|nr:MAG: hypothetical protein EON79_06000 [bacterium]